MSHAACAPTSSQLMSVIECLGEVVLLIAFAPMCPIQVSLSFFTALLQFYLSHRSFVIFLFTWFSKRMFLPDFEFTKQHQKNHHPLFCQCAGLDDSGIFILRTLNKIIYDERGSAQRKQNNNSDWNKWWNVFMHRLSHIKWFNYGVSLNHLTLYNSWMMRFVRTCD